MGLSEINSNHLSFPPMMWFIWKEENKTNLYTLTSNIGNHSDGKYDFVAEQWLDVIEMAVKFEEDFNEHKAFNPDYTIKLELSSYNANVVPIKPGFIDIRKG